MPIYIAVLTRGDAQDDGIDLLRWIDARDAEWIVMLPKLWIFMVATDEELAAFEFDLSFLLNQGESLQVFEHPEAESLSHHLHMAFSWSRARLESAP
jgi:hypothetical protein